MVLDEIKKQERNRYLIEKIAQRIVKNLCQLYKLQGINNQNIQKAQKLNSQKNQ
jgi:hypothetical protein